MGLSNRLALKTEPKEEIYFRAMTRLIETKGPIDGEDRGVLKQLCFICVKHISAAHRKRDGKEFRTQEQAEAKFTMIDFIMDILVQLTPQDIITMFPIDKTYDGHRWQTKDYYSTVEAINKYPINESIGRDNIFNLLWDYRNWDLNFFLVEYMSIMSDLRRLQGEMGIMEEFCQKEGIETFTYHEKEGYLQSNKTGKVTKVSKPKKRVPKQFKIVK